MTLQNTQRFNINEKYRSFVAFALGLASLVVPTLANANSASLLAGKGTWASEVIKRSNASEAYATPIRLLGQAARFFAGNTRIASETIEFNPITQGSLSATTPPTGSIGTQGTALFQHQDHLGSTREAPITSSSSRDQEIGLVLSSRADPITYK
jgi:hypothetical protein